MSTKWLNFILHTYGYASIVFNMTKIKWLWSIAIAMGIVLLYASLSAYFIRIDGWYASLRLPSFVLPSKGMTVGWSVFYLINILVLARIIYSRERLYMIVPLVILGIVNILWCMSFFVFHSLLAGFVILVIQSVMSIAIMLALIKSDTISMIFWQAVVVWYVYLCVVAYCILTNA